VSRHGHAFIDRALYLPKAWTEDPARLACAHVPSGTSFATKPRLARAMIARALAADVPFAWVTADSVYGVGAIERTLRGAGKGYVLGVKATQLFNSCGDKPPVAGMAAAIARGLDPGAWRRLSAGAGSKGERLFDWAYCELADLEAAEDNPDTTGLWTRGLLIRGNLADGELAFFSTWCPAGTAIATLVAVGGQRWAIEDAFETAKTELGLTHNETRSWHGWHRHVSLVMLGFARLARIRHHANTGSPPKTNPLLRRIHQLSSGGRFRRSVA
jgi:SRSO17 transposase